VSPSPGPSWCQLEFKFSRMRRVKFYDQRNREKHKPGCDLTNPSIRTIYQQGNNCGRMAGTTRNLFAESNIRPMANGVDRGTLHRHSNSGRTTASHISFRPQKMARREGRARKMRRIYAPTIRTATPQVTVWESETDGFITLCHARHPRPNSFVITASPPPKTLAQRTQRRARHRQTSRRHSTQRRQRSANAPPCSRSPRSSPRSSRPPLRRRR
jgi:hypothetical protein